MTTPNTPREPTVFNYKTLTYAELTTAMIDIVERADPKGGFGGNREQWIAREKAAGTLLHTLATWAKDTVDRPSKSKFGDLDQLVARRFLHIYCALTLDPNHTNFGILENVAEIADDIEPGDFTDRNVDLLMVDSLARAIASMANDVDPPTDEMSELYALLSAYPPHNLLGLV